MIRRILSTAALVAVLLLVNGCDVLASLVSDSASTGTPSANPDTTVSLVITGLAGGARTYAWIGDFGTDEWDNATRTFAVSSSGAGTAAATKLIGSGANKLLEFSFVEVGTWDVPWYDAGQFGIDDNRFDALSNFAVQIPLDKKAHSLEITYLNHNFPQVTIDGGNPVGNLTYGLANRPTKVVSLDAAGMLRTNGFSFNSTSLLTWTREYGYQADGIAAYNSTSAAYPVYFRAAPLQSVWSYDPAGNLTTITDTLPPPSAAGLYPTAPRTWSPGTYRDLGGWTAALKASPGFYRRPASIALSSPLVIPASAVVLEDNLFDQVYGVTGPDTIDFSAAAGLTTIGAASFANFPSLTQVTLPATVTAIGDNAFSGGTGITTLSIGSGTVTIGEAAFAGLTSLTAIDVPDSVTFIDSNAFAGDSQVTTLNLGTVTGGTGGEVFHANLKVIGGAAFANLGIAKVVLPASLLEIRGFNAFAGCSALVEVVIDGSMTAPPKMAPGSGTFGGLPANFKIWVPSALLSAFQSAPGWSDYSDHIFGY